VESVLIDTWLLGEEGLSVVDQAAISMGRSDARRLAETLGFTLEDRERVANIASELCNNQLAHAREGTLLLRTIERSGVPGIELVAADRGEGIVKPAEALAGNSTKASLGAGLGAVRGFADEVDFDVRLGEGTCVWARKFRESVPRAREVGILGRPHPLERVGGDHACFVRGAHLTLAVADGIGHGPEAAHAAQEAIRAVTEGRGDDPESLLKRAHTLSAQTRGAVMAIARVDEHVNEVSVASAGNTSTAIVGPKGIERFGGSSFALGSRVPHPRIRLSHATLTRWDAVVLHTDGISSRFNPNLDPDLLRQHPLLIAHRILLDFGVENDDGLVLVAR
jgi:anti-sigma regulatory factor (Ser/Thr protein kinase)